MSDALKAADIVEIPDDIWDAQDAFMDLGWGDGLPIIPPTPERVERMLTGTTRSPDELLGVVPPRKGLATVRCIAVNAVMAGARPAYLPVILAALEAVIDPAFNIQGVNCTGHNCGPLVIVSGPIVAELNINAGMGLFGPGWAANATIGRAVRLCMLNIGGATPGKVDRSVHGHPGKYTYCIGEDAAYGPWSKLNEDYGYPDRSIVLVLAAEAPHTAGAGSVGTSGFGIMKSLSDTCATLGSNKMLTNDGHVLVVVGPYHSERLFSEGWTKEEVRLMLFEHVRRSVRDLRGVEHLQRRFEERSFPRWVDLDSDDSRIPLVHSPAQFIVMATPGENAQSSIVPTWSLSSIPVARPIGS